MDDRLQRIDWYKRISEKVHLQLMPTIECNEGLESLIVIMNELKKQSTESETDQIFILNVNSYIEENLNTGCSDCRPILLTIKKYCNEVFNT